MKKIFFISFLISSLSLFGQRKLDSLFHQVELCKNNRTRLCTTFQKIAVCYSKLNDHKNANYYFSKYVALKDSLFDEETRNTIKLMSIKYESDKKDQENFVLNLENNNKKQIIYLVIGFCAVLFILTFNIYRSYKQKQKTNLILKRKNLIINRQKFVVEEQHVSITDSIKYATRIQSAILPPRNLWKEILPNSFVLYMPKDVLSGDFYWIEQTEKYIYVAAADCTGHGVPGALLSIVNYNLLNKAVLEQKITDPGKILDKVNQWLTESLHQTYIESNVKDGMDISIIAINKETKEILFAGANNPIYVVHKGNLMQHKADKFAVGGYLEEQVQGFQTKKIMVEEGDVIYLFSDGFADQFGGPNGKKYKYQPMQEKLTTIYAEPLNTQRIVLKEEFNNWMGRLEQVDDVLIIGIKI